MKSFPALSSLIDKFTTYVRVRARTYDRPARSATSDHRMHFENTCETETLEAGASVRIIKVLTFTSVYCAKHLD